MAEDNAHPQGRVVRVIGPVVDVEFPPNELPDIYTALTVDITLGDTTTTITCEVAQHIGDNIIRAIALKPTDGLTRGAAVINTGAQEPHRAQPLDREDGELREARLEPDDSGRKFCECARVQRGTGTGADEGGASVHAS